MHLLWGEKLYESRSFQGKEISQLARFIMLHPQVSPIDDVNLANLSTREHLSEFLLTFLREDNPRSSMLTKVDIF